VVDHYLYLDETGTLDFEDRPGEEYFGVGTPHFEGDHRDAIWDGHQLRVGLEAKGIKLPKGLHAKNDSHSTRGDVYATIAAQQVRFDATLLKKSSAFPSVRTSRRQNHVASPEVSPGATIAKHYEKTPPVPEDGGDLGRQPDMSQGAVQLELHIWRALPEHATSLLRGAGRPGADRRPDRGGHRFSVAHGARGAAVRKWSARSPAETDPRRRRPTVVLAFRSSGRVLRCQSAMINSSRNPA
jgi:hypothetical protein